VRAMSVHARLGRAGSLRGHHGRHERWSLGEPRILLRQPTREDTRSHEPRLFCDALELDSFTLPWRDFLGDIIGLDVKLESLARLLDEPPGITHS
jgi:hypothetical protein